MFQPRREGIDLPVNYRDRFKKGVILCTTCNLVEIAKKAVDKCPECEMGTLCNWEDTNKFKLFLKHTTAKHLLRVNNPELKKIMEDVV